MQRIYRHKRWLLGTGLVLALLVVGVSLLRPDWLWRNSTSSQPKHGRNNGHVQLQFPRQPTPTATPRPTPTLLSQVDGPLAEDIFDVHGTLDPVAYRRIAANYGAPEGITYRYGPDYKSYPHSNDPFPTYWEPPDKHFDNHGNGSGWDYEVGGPQDKTKNDYSSNMGQVLYSADSAGDHGVDTLTTLLMAENTYSEKPQLPWVYYGGGHPEPNVQRNEWIAANGGPVVQPVALGRSYGYGNWNSEDLIAFNDGFIGAAGSNTADAALFLKLPPNKVPTSVALTNNSEFALVTIWDTQALKGQVAVLALASNAATNWWGGWKDLYPGLRNLGLFTFIKLLGFVDLPGMVAPTAISASTDYRVGGKRDPDQGWMISPDGKDGRYTLFQLTLSDETNRQSFITGPDKDLYSKAGFAVVVSKSERKAIFLDLKPLFQKVQTMYFTTRDNFLKTQDVGQAPGQWPYTFDVAPDFAPTIITTISLVHRPTAVLTSLGDDIDQAYIATQDGTLNIYSVSGYGDGSAATPAAIQLAGSVQVGHNPTCIAYAKDHGWGSPSLLNHEFIVLSRGDRKIDWVKLTGAGGTIVRTLRDSRMLDPVWVEDNDNHGTESYLLTVADYAGKQVLNYRYGPVIYHTNGNTSFGMGPDGQAPFEFGGAYKTAGGAFQFSEANVP